MPSKTLYLDDAKSQPLNLEWGMFFRNFTASYNGFALEPIAGGTVNKGGLHYVLPDGRPLSITVKSGLGTQDMEVLLDEKPLAGSATHPLERIKKAWYALLVVGLISVCAGAATELLNVAVLRNLGVGWSSAIEGLIFIGLGWWGYSRQSALAFYLALGLYVAEWVFSLVALAQAGGAGGAGGTGGIFLRIFISVLLFRGARAAQQYQKLPAAPLF